MLKQNCTLAKLGLSIRERVNTGVEKNAIKDEGAVAISNALLQNRTLTVLDLGTQAQVTMSVGCNDVNTKGIKALANAVQHNQTLSELNLGILPFDNPSHKDLNAFGDENVKVLSMALSQNRSIAILHLCSSPCTTRGSGLLNRH